ncbi:hypothetical protein KFK09_011245 [Dendrobium nobile]|uniref:Uncharacterized protein n=1 Tax=Dendrobium nobile TaxID=94219 RepID=A0A8T3BEC9_DENNO|nr:hypothetical protein KFK09_011245 [Dendrobium nobile]
MILDPKNLSTFPISSLFSLRFYTSIILPPNNACGESDDPSTCLLPAFSAASPNTRARAVSLSAFSAFKSSFYRFGVFRVR